MNVFYMRLGSANVAAGVTTDMSLEGQWWGTWEDIRTGYPLTAVCDMEYRVMRMAMASRQEKTRRDKGKAPGAVPAIGEKEQGSLADQDRRPQGPHTTQE